jgi:hypothetical protein
MAGSPPPSFTVSTDFAAWSLAIAGNRLYGAGPLRQGTSQSEVIAVWNSVSSLTAERAPDFALGSSSGIGASAFIPFVTVTDDVLIAVLQANQVLIWNHAAALTGEAAPSFTLATGLQSPTKAVLDGNGRLYVLDSAGVAIYQNVPTAPAFVVKLTAGIANPSDIALLPAP